MQALGARCFELPKDLPFYELQILWYSPEDRIHMTFHSPGLSVKWDGEMDG